MLTELEYQPDSSRVFESLLGLPYAIFLDSGHGSECGGRYDILAANPGTTLTTRENETEIKSGDRSEYSCRDPLELVREHLGTFDAGIADLPFTGGALGYLAYDLGRRYEAFEVASVRDIDMPEMIIGIYDWALIVDHQRERSTLVSSDRNPATRDSWSELCARLSKPSSVARVPFEVVSPICSNFDRPAYARAFERVQDHIRKGDCYQINLAQRFSARVCGESWDAFRTLRHVSPAPYSAYFSTPEGDVLSSSPERFLRLEGDLVETKPIKGTRPRAAGVESDARNRRELSASAKDRAENVMIVDLLRNDLGKSCVPGSVKPTKLFDIESFAQVHHLVSTVTGRLAPDHHPLDLVRGCFPGGSITGAPKVRAMQIIDEIEPHRRSVYCGSIGYLGYNGRMDLNIAIRTLLRSGESIHAWAGSGIVTDSDADLEYQECLDKASGLLRVLDQSTISAAI